MSLLKLLGVRSLLGKRQYLVLLGETFLVPLNGRVLGLLGVPLLSSKDYPSQVITLGLLVVTLPYQLFLNYPAGQNLSAEEACVTCTCS